MNLYLRILPLMKPYRWHFLGAIGCSAVVAVLTATYAWLVRPILDDILIKKNQTMLTWLPPIVFLVVFLRSLAHYGQSYLIRYVGHHVIADIRNGLYHHLLLLPVGYHARQATGKLISRMIHDVGLMQVAVSTVVKDILQHVLTLIALTGVIFYQNWRLACLSAIVVPLTSYPLLRMGKRLRRLGKAAQEEVGQLTSLLQETLGGVRIVKAFGKEDFQSSRFSKQNAGYLKTTLRGIRVSEMASPLVETGASIGAVGIIWYGGYEVIAGDLTAGAFFSFISATSMMYGPLRGLASVNNALQQAAAGAERVFSLWDKKNERQEEHGRQTMPAIHSLITFQNVSFRYEDSPSDALANINLKVRHGDIVAFVGSSGAGKSTLMNLIPRFYEPTAGTIFIDNVPIADVTLASLRNQIGMVSQEAVLFDGTIRQNIAYGENEISDEAVIQAAKEAHAHAFILRLPGGYDTPLEKGATNLSGGERQLVMIARAILRNPKILLLDEATSALDAESEFVVRKALMNLMKDRTTFVIAHRLSTIKRATCIVVLDRGRIVETGRHDDLIARNGHYQRLYQMQFADDPLVASG